MKEALLAEKAAIEKRIKEAAGEVERELLESQFGERLAHLAQRLKEWIEPPPPRAPA